MKAAPQGNERIARALDEMNDLLDAVRLIAETPTTSETPGVARDELFDHMVGACRAFIKRDDGAASMFDSDDGRMH